MRQRSKHGVAHLDDGEMCVRNANKANNDYLKIGWKIMANFSASTANLNVTQTHTSKGARHTTTTKSIGKNTNEKRAKGRKEKKWKKTSKITRSISMSLKCSWIIYVVARTCRPKSIDCASIIQLNKIHNYNFPFLHYAWSEFTECECDGAMQRSHWLCNISFCLKVFISVHSISIVLYINFFLRNMPFSFFC